jgi:hypothetical protein
MEFFVAWPGSNPPARGPARAGFSIFSTIDFSVKNLCKSLVNGGAVSVWAEKSIFFSVMSQFGQFGNVEIERANKRWRGCSASTGDPLAGWISEPGPLVCYQDGWLHFLREGRIVRRWLALYFQEL